MLADLDGDNRNELIFGTSDGIVHAMRRDGTELPAGRCTATRCRCTPAGTAFTSGAVAGRLHGGAILASPSRSRDLDRDGTPEVVAADMEGKRLRLERRRHAAAGSARPSIAFSGKPLAPFVNVRQGER